MTDILHRLYHLRRALQALAAFTGDDTFCEVAAALDQVAARLWEGRKG